MDRVECLSLKTEGDTKVYVASSGGAVTWQSNDEIAILTTSSATPPWKTCTVDASNNRVEVQLAGGETRQGYAVYPAARVSSLTTSAVSVVYPTSYDITGDLSSEKVPIPMVAVNASGNSTLAFKQIGGILRITATIPANTKYVTVTTTGSNMCGVAAVTNPGADNATSSISSGTNTATFTVHASGLASAQAVVLNLPVPCGTYSSLTVKAKNSSNTEIATYTDNTSRSIGHAQGRKITVSAGTLSSVTVSGATSVIKGNTITLSASASGSNGQTVPATITWYSRDAGVATVNASTGVVTGVGYGTARIYAVASYGGNTATSSDHSVTVPHVLTTVTISPASATIWTTDTQQLTATAKDADGNAISGATVTWTRTGGSSATINATGLVTATTTAGETTFQASVSYGGVTQTANCTITVKKLASVTLSSSSNFSVNVGETSSPALTAAAADNTGATINGVTVNWISSNTGVATVSNGTVTGVSAGTSTISASVTFKGITAISTSNPTVTVVQPVPPAPYFSVSATDKVFFASSNLKKDGSTYSFHTNPWDRMVTSNGTSISSRSYDFFTDAEATSRTIGDYTWWVLTSTQWNFLFTQRTDAANKWGVGKVHDVNGLIILPDYFVDPNTNGIGAGGFVPGNTNGWNTNIYSDWNDMDAAGAIFLPAAGRYIINKISGDMTDGVGEVGYYWNNDRHTGSSSSARGPYYLSFNNSQINAYDWVSDAANFRRHSIRLVRTYTPSE